MLVRGLRVGLLGGLCAVAGSLVCSGAVAWGDSCPNAAFRMGPSASLPDCRAYELVTPAFKDGGLPNVNPFGSPGFTPLDGSNLIFASFGGFGNPGGNVGTEGSRYTAGRTAAGWASTPIEPPEALFYNVGGLATPFTDASSDFNTSLFEEVPASSVKPIDKRFYLSQPDGSLVEVGPAASPSAVAAEPPNENRGVNVLYKGASSDLSHVLFVLEDNGHTVAFWPGDGTLREAGTLSSLYEYIGTGNSAPILVGVDNTGQQITQCGTALGGGNPFSGSAYNAISTDGSTVFFTAAAGGCTSEGVTGSGPPVAEVFARIDQSRTVAISEPSSADCSACNTASLAEALFEGASRDGSKAFFLTSQALLGTDTTQNLYSFDSGAPAGQRVTRVSAGDPVAANVQGVVRVSEDGSHVYFVAQGVLTTTPNGQGQSAQAGNDNLYVHEPDPAHPGQSMTVFVAALSGSDSNDWETRDDARQVEATPDGRFLLFASTNDLTPDASGAGQQLYRYDSLTGELVRVTVGEGGFNNNGNGTSSRIFVRNWSALSPVATPGVSMSDDGAYVFFQSTSGLTPQALNNVCLREEEGECIARAQNVYEYHEGHVYLISDGQDRHLAVGESPVVFIGASASGSDVFFTTADALVPQDGDGQVDVYDARIDGGFPPPQSAPGCAGEACQPLAVAPSEQTPGSSVFSGPGNPTPSHAKPKPKPKRKGKQRHHKRRKRSARRAAKNGHGGAK